MSDEYLVWLGNCRFRADWFGAAPWLPRCEAGRFNQRKAASRHESSSRKKGAGTGSRSYAHGTALERAAVGWRRSREPNLTGNADMSCPEKKYYDSTLHASQGSAFGFPPAACRLAERGVRGTIRPLGTKRLSLCHSIIRRAACRILPRNGTVAHSEAVFAYPPSQHMRDMASRRSGRPSMSVGRTLLDRPGPLTFTADRVSNVQQNAHRCVSPRRNQGGRRPR